MNGDDLLVTNRCSSESANSPNSSGKARLACSTWITSPEHGKALYQQVCLRDLEGIVAKPAESRYGKLAGKSPWIKIKNPTYTQNEGRGEMFNRRR